MASFSRQYSTASPVLAIAPRPSHQPPLSAARLAHQHTPPAAFGAVPLPSATNISVGRKRSRDEASINFEPDPQTSVADKSQQGWTYGPGMVLIKPDEGYVADASSQSGTWLEEKKASDEQASRRQQVDGQLDLRSHKSQRMDPSIDQAPSPNEPNSDIPGVPAPHCASLGGAGDVVIDDFTLHLGIGWRRIRDDEDMQAAARGWGRFIENHSALTNVRMYLKSKGLQLYLVEASEGYFLLCREPAPWPTGQPDCRGRAPQLAALAADL